MHAFFEEICSLLHSLRFDLDYVDLLLLAQVRFLELVHPITLIIELTAPDLALLLSKLLFHFFKGLREVVYPFRFLSDEGRIILIDASISR
jgi:hypothetical protein